MPGLDEVAPGVLVRTSEVFLTTSTVIVGARGGCLLVDPAVTPADLDELAAELAGRGLRPQAGWSTHPHWDHVLWSAGFGDVPRFATSLAAATAARESAGLAAAAAEFSVSDDVARLAAGLTALEPAAGQVPWDGPEARVISHDGHAPGHGALFLPEAGVLIAGDMCSDIETPLLDLSGADPLGDYRSGLARLAALAGDVQVVIPGHGHVGDAAEFRRRLDADARYLDLLGAGKAAEDPRLSVDWLRAELGKQLALVRGESAGLPG